MIELRLQTEVHSTAETVFDALADLRAYDRWLARSASFPGITDISPGPIAAGTTFVESEPNGVRHGTVTELQSPTRIAFHQPMTMKRRALGTVDIDVGYTLTAKGASVHVDRLVHLGLPWPLKAVRPLVVRKFHREGQRTLLALKSFAETQR